MNHPLLTNWKTTLGGAAAFLLMLAAQLEIVGNTLNEMMEVLAVGFLALSAVSARDWNKSSQDNEIRP